MKKKVNTQRLLLVLLFSLLLILSFLRLFSYIYTQEQLKVIKGTSLEEPTFISYITLVESKVEGLRETQREFDENSKEDSEESVEEEYRSAYKEAISSLERDVEVIKKSEQAKSNYDVYNLARDLESHLSAHNEFAENKSNEASVSTTLNSFTGSLDKLYIDMGLKEFEG